VTGAGAKQRIVVSGALAQRPGVPGHAWVFLNWLLGLRSLGRDVVFVDRLEPEMLEPDESVVESRQMAWLESVMTAAGFGGDYAVLVGGGRACLGMTRDELRRRTNGAAALLNFMGYLDDEEIRDAVGHRVFVDIDPGFGQLWREQGLHDPFAGHDAVATVGLGAEVDGSIVGRTGLPTVPTLPPVALDHWQAADPATAARVKVTSVATWRGPFGPVEHEGVRYGLRVHEFRRFADLPRRVPAIDCELALDIDAADAADAARLQCGGWRLVEPAHVVGDLAAYRAFIAASSAELMVAKEMYVRTGSGWFSDRSACYLAMGRPVVAQDTGFTAHLPTGAGLLSFVDPDSAAAGLDAVATDLTGHARAAREIARTHFDARRVLASLLDRVGVA
jgi:hypothetical protein